jgi:AraC-like DNA-binding protein
MTVGPLNRYPAIRTSQVEVFEHQLTSVYGATGFDLKDPSSLAAQGNFVQLSDVALGFGECGTQVEVWFGETDFARLQLSLRGQCVTRIGNATAMVTPGQPVLTSPGRPVSLQYGEDFEHLFLRVRSDALTQKLTALLGIPIRQPIEFEPADFPNKELMSGLHKLIQQLVQQLDDGSSLLSPLALKEIEQAITVQLLFAARHRWTALLVQEPLAASETQLRQVEEYIEANCNQAITIESLSEVAGISARTLFRAFERTRGCSPMAFVKKTRLEHARAALENPGHVTSVSGVAFACGFSNLGHFASDYRRLFGELPSDTLKRSCS